MPESGLENPPFISVQAVGGEKKGLDFVVATVLVFLSLLLARSTPFFIPHKLITRQTSYPQNLHPLFMHLTVFLFLLGP